MTRTQTPNGEDRVSLSLQNWLGLVGLVLAFVLPLGAWMWSIESRLAQRESASYSAKDGSQLSQQISVLSSVVSNLSARVTEDREGTREAMRSVQSKLESISASLIRLEGKVTQ
jgi:hypothetical protein